MKKLIFTILVLMFSTMLFKTIYAQSDCNPDGTGTDGLCSEECGADSGCDGEPIGSWCDNGVYKTCDNNCHYTEICDPSCRLSDRDEPCGGLEPDTECCSGCFYVNINDKYGRKIINILDVSTVAIHFGLSENDCRGSTCYNSSYDINSDDTIDILDVSNVARKFGADCNTTTTSTSTTTAPQLQTEELGFTFSNILVVLIVVLVIVTILLSFKFFVRGSQVASAKEDYVPKPEIQSS